MPKIRSGGRTDSGSPRSRTKGFRPLGPLADEALKRGKRSYNLWYLYGPKAGSDLVVSSDAQAMGRLVERTGSERATVLGGQPRAAEQGGLHLGSLVHRNGEAVR